MDDNNGDWTRPGAVWMSSGSSYPNSSWEECSNHEQPGSVHFHPSYTPCVSATSEDLSYRPLQDPFNLEHASITPPYPGNHLVGHPSPTSQHVSAQDPFNPMVSGAPSGASVPPAFVYYAPPPHPPGWSPAPPGYPPYHPRLEMSFVQPARLDVQPVSASWVSSEGYVQESHTIPALLQDGLFDVPLNVYSPRPPRLTWPCPLCNKLFRRPQDRNRHLPSHLPYWVGCSYDDCFWRGYRLDAFRKHWHSEHNQVPDESGSKLYDPGPLVRGIIERSVLLEEAEDRAIAMVRKIAFVLDKPELLMDPWGRKGKTLKGARKYHRVTKRTNAPSITSSTPSVPPAKLPLTTHPYLNPSHPKRSGATHGIP